MNKFAVMGAGATIAVIAGTAGFFGYERHAHQVQLQQLEVIAARSVHHLAGNQFRSQVITGAGALCAEMNSPDGRGGMTGFRRVIASENGDAYVEGGDNGDATLFKERWSRLCGIS